MSLWAEMVSLTVRATMKGAWGSQSLLRALRTTFSSGVMLTAPPARAILTAPGDGARAAARLGGTGYSQAQVAVSWSFLMARSQRWIVAASASGGTTCGGGPGWISLPL